MLAAPNRLKRSRDISRVFQRGRFGGGGGLTAKTLANHTPDSRAVVVVSKKVSKRAVVRNRIRRRVAGILADEWQTVAPGYDIVITVREDVSDATASALKQQTLKALERAGVITNS